jgi:glycerophosphoryl diester phosphodiesterase
MSEIVTSMLEVSVMPIHSPLLVVGHRGLSGHYPENTASSIKAAAEEGLAWVEVDVQPTKEGALVVTHDHTLERCSNGTGRVDEHTLLDLYELDFGLWKGPQFEGESILTLEALLHLAQQYDLGINLEIKLDRSQQSDDTINSVVDNLLSTLEHFEFSSDKVVISSFCQATLREVRRQSSSVCIGVLADRLGKDHLQLIEELGAYSCHLNHFWVTETQISKLKKLGVKVWCYTVNKPHKFKHLDQVDGIFTDYPERFAGIKPTKAMANNAT